jgi:hypothetical protein
MHFSSLPYILHAPVLWNSVNNLLILGILFYFTNFNPVLPISSR